MAETGLRVLITGGAGMLGRSLARAWEKHRPADTVIPLTRADADLRDPLATARAFDAAKPDVVLHCAARVGGIAANIAAPTEFLSDNLAIDLNVINSARVAGVKSLIYFGSSCMYPRDYRQPLVESDVLAAPLEPTNEGYALAKIAASKHCEYISNQYGLAYRVLIPSNLYGPEDHYGSDASHLIAAAITKAQAAKESDSDGIEVWGDGTARREFTYVDDLGAFVATHIDELATWPHMMNVGLGKDYSVAEFYEMALAAVGHQAKLLLDPSKPAGMQQKLMDSSLAKRYGWNPTTDAADGIKSAYDAWITATNTKDAR